MKETKEPRAYIVEAYILVEPDQQELLTLDEAQREVEQLELMSPEDIARIVKVQ